MAHDRMTRDYLRLFAETRGIGLSPYGGVDRLALSAGDAAMRAWFVRELRQAGAEVRIDAVGNVYGLFEWVPGAQFVLAGSHLDSQPNGGAFDGVYGVASALAAAKELDARVRAGRLVPQRNVAVVDWTNEEGARFQPSVLGSRVFTGALRLQDALAARDAGGTTLADALEAVGFDGADEPPHACAYVEAHVEQGGVLESEGADIGLVVGNWAAAKMQVTVEGEQSHTGSTPMEERKDAVYGAARAICAVRDLAAQSDGALRTSATCVRSHPESANTVASVCSFHAEVRARETYQVERGLGLLHDALAQVSEETGLSVSTDAVDVREPLAFWPAGVRLAGRVARSMRLSTHRMETVCGHDSVALNAVVPTIMLFVPSVGGYAHSPKEDTSEKDQVNGLHEVYCMLEHLVSEKHLDRKRPIERKLDATVLLGA